ncbi:MAG: NAD-dependent epimerase/dehydratase family protein [Chloroflexi bacterium]|nr:NAD-dependent epimerase/dehydratase family protein [Chloroflexota bacterium]
MTDRVLVTGGAGFIGSHVVDAYLAEGYDVAVVDDLSTGRRENLDPRARLYHLDLLHPGLEEVFLRERPRVVNHHAAQISIRISVQDPYQDAQVNILGSLRLLQLCQKYEVDKLVFASSGGAIYGDPQQMPCPEGHPLHPLSPYGVAKMAVEHYLAVMRSTHGLDFTILRYGNVYGPRQDPLGEAGVVAIFIGHMLKNEPVTINGDGEQTRDFVYVGDVAQANLLATARGSGEACNIGMGSATSVNTILRHLAQLTSYSAHSHHGPPLPGEVRHIYLDIERARRVLGWQPATGLEEGLARTVAYFRDTPHLPGRP